MSRSHDKPVLSGAAHSTNSWFLSKDRNSRQKQQQQQQQQHHRQACAPFYKRVREAIQSEKSGVEDLLKWASGTYAAQLSHLNGGRHGATVRDPDRIGEAKLEKYKARGLTYSVRHISPAIQRRQRADQTQSKDLSVLIEELEHHDKLWTAYVAGFKDSLGSGLSAEQKDAAAKQNDDKLYEIYKLVWVIVEKLNATTN